MSADGWIDCFFCVKKYNDEIAKLKTQLNEAYMTMVACEYDNFEKEINKQIKVIQLEIEEHAQAAIYDISNYDFDEQGNLIKVSYASCANCNRLWKGTHAISPVIRSYKDEFGKKEE